MPVAARQGELRLRAPATAGAGAALPSAARGGERAEQRAGPGLQLTVKKSMQNNPKTKQRRGWQGPPEQPPAPKPHTGTEPRSRAVRALRNPARWRSPTVGYILAAGPCHGRPAGRAPRPPQQRGRRTGTAAGRGNSWQLPGSWSCCAATGPPASPWDGRGGRGREAAGRGGGGSARLPGNLQCGRVESGGGKGRRGGKPPPHSILQKKGGWGAWEKSRC